MAVETTVSELKINKMTKAQYDSITPSDTEAYEFTDLSSILDGKQATLVSGTNIKTINNESLLGSGNISISGGGSVDQTYTPTSTNAQSGVAIAGAGFLQNTATGTNAITIGGTASSSNTATNIGTGTSVTATAGTAIGRAASVSGTYATGLGTAAKVTAAYGIQIGYGTNSTASTLSVGFNASSPANRKNWTLLDGTTGLIPYERIPYDNSSITINSNGELQVAGLSNKADTDLANVTDTGYTKMAGAGMPGTTYTDLAIGASGATYTAPANGYFYIYGGSGGDTNYHHITAFYNSANNWVSPALRTSNNAPSA